MDACLPGTQQVSTDFDRSGPGRARTRHRRAGSQFSSDVSARCAALCHVLGCPRRACPGKCRRPAASCHACLTSDTPTSRLTLSQACLQSHQSSWQSRQSYQFRCRVRSWLRAPLFNSHRPHPGLIGATALAMYTAILTAPLAIKRDSARSCMHNVCIVRRATTDTLGYVYEPHESRLCAASTRACYAGLAGRMALWRRAEGHQRDLMRRFWACLMPTASGACAGVQ